MSQQHSDSQKVMEWIETKKSKEYILLYEEIQAGKFWFEDWAHGAAKGETPSGCWNFSKVGFWKPKYIITRDDTGEEVAGYKPNWSISQGTLQTSEGEIFRWEMKSSWKGEYILTNESGKTIFTLTKGLKKAGWKDLFKQQATIFVHEDVKNEKMFSVLLLFSWWVILLQVDEEASAGTVIACCC